MIISFEPACQHHAERLGIALRQLSESPEEMILHRNTGRRLPAPLKQNAANYYDYHYQLIRQREDTRTMVGNRRVGGDRGKRKDFHGS